VSTPPGPTPAAGLSETAIATVTPLLALAPTETATVVLVVSPAALPSPSPVSLPSVTATATISPSVTPSGTPTAGTLVHTVASGETLFEIADRYGVTPEAIIAANDLRDPDALSEGQRLVIPPKASDQ
jgi:LysM repeat protein